MTVRTPKYIKMIERKTETVFSVLSVNDVTIEQEKLAKMSLVYVNQAYPDGNTKELLYTFHQIKQLDFLHLHLL